MKKISQIIAYTILGVLVVGLVLTAVLKKSFAPNIAIPAHSAGGIEISVPNMAKYEGLGDEEDYNEFVKLYNSSFELTILYSIFSGKISREQTITNNGTTAPSYTNGYVVTFLYPQDQEIKVNGEVWHESVNSNTPITYKKVTFNILEGRGLTTTYIYFYNSENNSYYKLTTLANFDALYNFVSELPMFAEEEE